MSLELLQREWQKFLGEDGIRIATEASAPSHQENILNKYSEQCGIRGSCHYLLSSQFEQCGLLDSDRSNFSLVLAHAMSRSVTAMQTAQIPASESAVLVGLSPYKFFGAEVMKAQHGYIVLVSPVTFSFCFLFALLSVISAQATGLMEQGLVPRDENGNALIDSFNWTYCSHHALDSAVEEFMETGGILAPHEKVAFARFDLLPWHYIERVQRTYEQMLDFLILHEFGHIWLGHMGRMPAVRRAVPLTSTSYEVASPLPLQEEAADDFALKCLVAQDDPEELNKFVSLLQSGNLQSSEWDNLFLGRSSISRYTSALQLLKLFDLFDNHSVSHANKARFTNSCEINGTHPSGQHRFLRAMFGDGSPAFTLSSGYRFNKSSFLSWSNWTSLRVSRRPAEDVYREARKLGMVSG